MTSGSSPSKPGLMNSSLFKARWAMQLAIVAVGATIATHFLVTEHSLLILIPAIPALLLTFIAIYFEQKVMHELRRGRDICTHAAKGDFEVRVTDIREAGSLGDLLWAVNELIDRTDSFVRESATAMEFVSQKKYFRPIVETGQLGVFKTASQNINKAIKEADNAHKAQLKVEEEVADIVMAAGVGDFSARLQTAGKEGFMKSLSEGINSILTMVDNGLDEVSEVVAALSEGDLDKRMVREYQGAFLALKNDLNAMSDKLSAIVTSVMESSETVSTGASQIAVGNSDLAQRTEQQANSVESTATAMEELTATVRSNAQNATEASSVASTTRDAARENGEIMDQAVKAMQEIAESSSKITDIVGMIEEIAFQTNLLALNAAVEAARAGEAGKGFAVVAQEVRSLAQRSSDASKDIKDLITETSGHINEGVSQVNQAGKSLSQIVKSIDQVAELVVDISSASLEQSQGLEDVGRAVNQMDEITQHNAALVEEAAAASESLARTAQGMQSQMTFFKHSTGRAGPKEKAA